MPRPEFFRSLGLFVATEFLDPAFCVQIREEMCDGAVRQGRIVGDGREEGVTDESVRRVSSFRVSKSTRLVVESHLEQLRPRLQDHFGLPLTGCEGPQFLRYGPNSFYKPHQDASVGAPTYVLQRKVSVVAFLNAPAADPDKDGYGGGALTFYGLLQAPGWEKCAFSLDPSAGLLVAFRPSVLHEVKPVIFGHRFTMVAWFTNKSLRKPDATSRPAVDTCK